MRREIDDILRVTTLDASLPAIAELSDVHTPVLVMRVSDELAGEPRLQDPRLVHMLEQDRQQGTEFARSLLAWFDEVGDVRAAALRLRIHPNTLRYRLRRVTEQFGVDLDRADSRLAVWMQLRALADGRVPTSP
jgi:DNA-binding PucR family transcriptional regulator